MQCFFFELIEPRGYRNMWTDFLCLLPLQSKVNIKGPRSWIPKFEHFYFASNFKFAYLSLEIVKCPKYNGCSIIMCPTHYCVQQFTMSRQIQCPHCFSMCLLSFPLSICWPSSLSGSIFCNKAFSGGHWFSL